MGKEGSKSGLKSIATKFALMVSIVLFMILAGRSVYDAHHDYHATLETRAEKAVEETKKLAKVLSADMSSAYKSAIEMKSILESILNTTPAQERKRETVIEILNQFVANNASLDAMGIYFEPDGFDENDSRYLGQELYGEQGRFAVYSRIDNGKQTTRASEGIDDSATNSWYALPLKEKREMILPPDMDAGITLVTIAVPIFDRDKVVGVINSDVFVDSLQENLEGYVREQQRQESEFIIVSNDAITIANTKSPEKVMRKLADYAPEYSEYTQAAVENKETVVYAKNSEGNDAHIVFVPISIDGLDAHWAYANINTISDFTRGIVRKFILGILVNVFTLLIISFAVYFLIIRMLQKPIHIVESIIDKIANYHLNLSEEFKQARKYENNQDEIGSMIRSILKMTQNLKTLISSISSTAQNAAATAQELTATSQSTAVASDEVLSAVNHISEGASSQAQDTKNAVTSVEESDVLLREMMEILRELFDSTNHIEERKTQGSESIKELRHTMDDNKTAAVKVNSVILDTNKSAEQISKASEMIQSISDQTNLLALNAAIEAARAGEAGRGFAVVAEEIRKLAEQSDGFTEEIRKVIDDLKVKSESAVETMKQVAVLVEMQAQKVSETEHNFTQISEAVDLSRTIVKKLNQSSAQIEKRNRNIMGLISNLSAVAQQNAATTEQAFASVESQTRSIGDISNASENLAEIAGELQLEISKFSL